MAVLAAATGWWFGRSVESPSDVARHAAAPAVGPVTVPVERRVVATSVVVRGTLGFAEPQALTVDADLGDGRLGKLVVTGAVPRAGTALDEGDVALQVSGRPVIVLDGVIPMYRALAQGSSGPDVRQLERALARLGHLTATPDDTYDSRTSTAVDRLYRAVGYAPVAPSAEQEQQLAAGRERVSAAGTAVAAARSALTAAREGPPAAQLAVARARVNSAVAARDAAAQERDDAVAAGAPAATVSRLTAEVAAAEVEIAMARSDLADLTDSKDVSSAQRGVAEAEQRLSAARSALVTLRNAVGVRIPRGEIAFVPSLPRRVDRVDTALGRQADGKVLSLTAAALEVTCAVTAEEQGLLKVGQRVELDEGDGVATFRGEISHVADKPGTGGVPEGQYLVRVKPVGSVPANLPGRDVRVRVPISTTSGAVLAVPLAALVSDASGATWVRVSSAQGARDVPVTVGLSADGFAEVRVADGDLAEADLVVVGERS
ncbi:peptidoglycan-binding domain-containing protein [Micromonospora sp. CV4]|uniref:peptidoglycan-binding domain-containing protein n=1 Tax=Micromonospora sp. CV4 TaxID=2478711 RepID=UPI000EF4CD92|nr:peptidoglycan-binding domain-containing protein [Micromonospora sp. CV4]RLP97819.1 peptidoglycan-binding protein [Micromonospora sp. CV4]